MWLKVAIKTKTQVSNFRIVQLNREYFANFRKSNFWSIKSEMKFKKRNRMKSSTLAADNILQYIQNNTRFSRN